MSEGSVQRGAEGASMKSSLVVKVKYLLIASTGQEQGQTTWTCMFHLVYYPILMTSFPPRHFAGRTLLEVDQPLRAE